MRAGELDRQIVVEQVTESRSASGAVTQTWSTFATIWANVRPLRGREYFSAAQVNAEIDCIFRIRWLSGMTTKMRINYDGKYWDIKHLAEIGRREGIDIMAQVHQG